MIFPNYKSKYFLLFYVGLVITCYPINNNFCNTLSGSATNAYVSPEDFFDIDNPLYDTDTEAIQAAIDDAVPTIGEVAKILLLQPRKVYLIEDPIEGKGISIIGNNAQFKKGGSSSFTLLNYTQSQDIFINELIIEGDETEINTDPKILLSGCRDVKLKNCKFFNCSSTAIKMVNCSFVAIHESNFENVGSSLGNQHVIDVQAQNGENRNFKIRNNIFSNIPANVIHTSGLSDPNVVLKDLIITHNTFTNIEGATMQFNLGNSIIATNNIVRTSEIFVAVGSETDVNNYSISDNLTSSLNTFLNLESSGTLSNLQLSGNVHVDGNHFIRLTEDANISMAIIASNVIVGILEYIYNGSGVNISITNNQFDYSGDVEWPISISDGQSIRVEGNAFKSVNQNEQVINIPPTTTPAYNIIRHNLFQTNFSTDKNLIHPQMNEDLSNIIQFH